MSKKLTFHLAKVNCEPKGSIDYRQPLWAVCLGDVLAFQKGNNRSLLNASQGSQETKGVKNV